MNFRIYQIPVEVPQNPSLTDGPYKLLIEMTDVAGNVAAAVLPIQVGPIATGDINDDGELDIVDVFMALQMSSGSLQGTQAQREAANLDGLPGVTLLDVILIFEECKNRGACAQN